MTEARPHDTGPRPFSLEKAAELVGCAPSELLQAAAIDNLPLWAMVAEELVDQYGEVRGAFKAICKLTEMDASRLYTKGTLSIASITLLQQTPTTSPLGRLVSKADAILGRQSLGDGLWSYELFPRTETITLAAKDLLIHENEIPHYKQVLKREGEVHGGSERTWDDQALLKLLDLHSSGMTHQQLAEHYNVSRQFIGKMLSKARDLFRPKKPGPFDVLGRSKK